MNTTWAVGVALILMGACVHAADLRAKVSEKTQGGHTLLDLRAIMNQTCFDDGLADNGKGGWTDEGLNDFRVYPPLTFGCEAHRGYVFDFVDPKTNQGKNLLMTGTDKHWPDLPRRIRLEGFQAKGAHVFVMHSEGRMKLGKDEVAGVLRVEYEDGTTASLPLRNNKEVANWYQGRWWGNYEAIHDDAPKALKACGFNEKKYKQLGGKDFKGDTLKFTTAIRWPVTQGLNAVSRNWSIPVVFWALKWTHPHPDKVIRSVTLESHGKCLIAIAAITITDKDFSLDRQTLGQFGPPPAAPAGFFEQIKAAAGGALRQKLAEQAWTKGIRDVQIRSDRVVTVRIDQIADFPRLKDKTCYRVSSADDPDFKQGVTPTDIDRFSRASRYRYIQKYTFELYQDHWMHLHLPMALKPGKHYVVELLNNLVPTGKHIRSRITFSLDATPNPSFRLNQVGYSAAAKIKYVYLGSYLGDGDPLDLSACKTFEVRSVADNQVVLKGEIKPHVDKDIQGLDKLYRLDISALHQEGEFCIWVPGLGRSYAFKNGDLAARAMYDVCHRGLFFQRSGMAINKDLGGKWPRPMAHNKIYVTKANITHPFHNEGKVDPQDAKSPYYVPGGPKEIHGGHYDAGDFDLRAMHINVPEFLMSLYESCPQKFYDKQVRIAEAGNGIPDILDEAAWNLLSLEYIQDYATAIRGLDGGVAPGLESYAHPQPGMDYQDTLPYYMRKITGYFSFCAAAAFAQAARLFAPFDKKRSERYLKRAQRAYGYGTAHLDDPQPLSTKGHNPDQGEGWDKRLLAGARTWAAAQLFATTGDKAYWDVFVQHYGKAKGGVAGSVSYWALVWPILTTQRQLPDATIRETLLLRLRAAADKNVAFVEEQGRQGYRAATPSGGGWGSTSCVVRNIEPATRAYLLFREQKYLDAMATSIDFSLGMNPSEMSWMTGAGTACPMDPCSHNSLYDNEEEPLPGILIYGPTNYWYSPKVAMYPEKKTMGFYRRVVDAWGHIAGCEYTVWETQAPFLFAVGCLLPDKE